ncbi:hypothetical protein NKH18_37250 [Streptomyces sp. M10(2022)]
MTAHDAEAADDSADTGRDDAPAAAVPADAAADIMAASGPEGDEPLALADAAPQDAPPLTRRR